ncbi:MAG: PRC-barrel domain-containing protein [Sphingomicrobium sp.]
MEDILNWAAPIATIIAALMTASNLGSRITGAGFIVFTAGSIAWFSLGVIQHNDALLWQNVVLTLLNLFGIWRWLGRQAKFEDGAHHAAEASEAEPVENLFPVSTLTSAPLLGRDGEPLGKCVDAMAGRSSGRIFYLVVAEGGVAGVGEKLRRVDWAGTNSDGEKIVAQIDGRQFAALDLLEKDQWPGR